MCLEVFWKQRVGKRFVRGFEKKSRAISGPALGKLHPADPFCPRWRKKSVYGAGGGAAGKMWNQLVQVEGPLSLFDFGVIFTVN